MFLIRTLLSQGTILCIVLLLVTLDVGFSTAKATTTLTIPSNLIGCMNLYRTCSKQSSQNEYMLKTQ